MLFLSQIHDYVKAYFQVMVHIIMIANVQVMTYIMWMHTFRWPILCGCILSDDLYYMNAYFQMTYIMWMHTFRWPILCECILSDFPMTYIMWMHPFRWPILCECILSDDLHYMNAYFQTTYITWMHTFRWAILHECILLYDDTWLHEGGFLGFPEPHPPLPTLKTNGELKFFLGLCLQFSVGFTTFPTHSKLCYLQRWFLGWRYNFSYPLKM